jgi:hypothetical protein
LLGSLGRKLGVSNLMFPSFEPILNQVSKKRKKYLIVTETHEVIVVRGGSEAVRAAAATAVTAPADTDFASESELVPESVSQEEIEKCRIEDSN